MHSESSESLKYVVAAQEAVPSQRNASIGEAVFEQVAQEWYIFDAATEELLYYNKSAQKRLEHALYEAGCPNPIEAIFPWSPTFTRTFERHAAQLRKHHSGQYQLITSETDPLSREQLQASLQAIAWEHEPAILLIVQSPAGHLFEQLQHEQQLNEELEAQEAELQDTLQQKTALVQTLSESKSYFKMITETVVDGISVHDRAGRYIYATPSWCEVLGLDTEEVVGRYAYDFIDKRDQQKVEEYSHALVLQGHSPKVRWRCHTKNNGTIWIESVSKAFKNEQDGREQLFIVASNRVVNEEIKLSRQLEQYSGLLEALQDSLGSPFFAVDQQFRYLYFNRTHKEVIKQMYGVDIREGLDVRVVLNKFPAPLREDAISYLRRAFQGERFSVTASYGEPARYFETFHYPLHSQKGKLMGAAILAYDRTEFITANMQAKAEAKRNEDILASIDEGMFFTDREMVFQYINPKGLEILHREKAEDLIGQNVWEAFPEAVGSAFQKYYTQALQTGQSTSFESYYPPLKIWFKVTAYPSEQGLSVYYRDITAEKLQLERIARNEQLISSINRNIKEALFRVQKGMLVYVNQAFLNMTGYTDTETVYSMTLQEFFKSPDALTNAVESLLEGTNTKEAEIEVSRKDGSTFWALITVSLINEEDGGIIIDGAMRDVTESKKYRERLEQQNSELKHLNRELDQFVYSVSHDLRAPIASSLGLIELAEMEDSVEGLKDYCRLQGKSLKKLDVLIGDIIDYSRNNRQGVTQETFNVEKMINSIFEQYNYLPESNKISKFVQIEGNKLVTTDKRRVQMVLRNLISNALNYSAFWKEDQYTKVLVQVTKEMLHIQVADNGVGISPEHLNKVFGMFFRAYPEKKGSGLGLYIVKEAVEKLNGQVGVESRLGEGTSFTVKIPLQQQ